MNNTMKLSALAWFTMMAYDDCKDDKSPISKIIRELNKFFMKRDLTTGMNMLEKNKYRKDLRYMQKIFEKNIIDPMYHDKLDSDMELPTIDFSPTVLALVVLDELLISKEPTVYNKYSHLDTGKMLMAIEEIHYDIFRSSLKIYYTMIKEMKDV